MAAQHLSVSQMNRRRVDVLSGVDEGVAAVVAAHPATTPEELLALEKAAEAFGAEIADRIVEHAILKAHSDASTRKVAGSEVRRRFREAGEDQRIDNLGPRPASVRMAGGGVLRVQTPYFRPNRKGLLGRPRTKRGVDGSGRYPVLEQLGIEDGVTPLMRSKLSRMVVLCSSYAEAVAQLASDGVTIDVSTLVRVAVTTGDRALGRRDGAIAHALANPLPAESMVAGKRIRVSLDGGRARTRHTHTERRKQRNGRRAFTLDWREPRVITIDVLQDDGEIDRDVPPIYEVELGDADRVFDVLAGMLRLIGAHEAAEVVFVADGADWIWARVDALIKRAEIPSDRVRKILDFYHASEHISDALKACKNLTDVERKSLHHELAKLLLQPDGAQQVIERLSTLARGRRGGKVNKEIRYLRKHLPHMRYAEWRAAKTPIGSGVVESAIRRVINQRFKAASMCWREDHLLPLLYLRCILKSGRWDAFVLAALRRRHYVGETHKMTEGRQAA